MRSLAIRLVDISLSLAGKAIYLFSSMLGWRSLTRFGGLLGDVIYFASNKKREITGNELGLLLGARFNERQIKDISKRSFENYYKRQIETIFFGSLSKEMLEDMVSVKGLEHIDAALSNGKGVILLLSHFGSFLLPLPFLGYRGYKVNQITGKQIHGSIMAERIWEWRRKDAEKLPVRFKQVDKFLRPVYQALKDNEIIAIAFDGRDSTHWEVVDFLERRARFSTGPFELARRTGAVIIPTFIIRKSDDTHKIVFEPPFKLSSDEDTGRALAADTENFTRIFSGYVSSYPCHFGMVLYKSRIMLKFNEENALFVDE
jgi:KDO2-lipid IV(A) lauroyltransferase